MSEKARLQETARALEICLSRLRLDTGTAHILRGNLGSTRQAIERAEATEKRLASEGPWPNGCIKPGSCSRHKACMYGFNGSCRHDSRDISKEVEEA